MILETGLRTAELIGLTWDAIDFEKRTLTINKTLEFRYNSQTWRAGPPKTPQSYRTIPLTDRACEILKSVWESREGRKESPILSEVLEYMDRRTGHTSKLVMRDLVFINYRTGAPAKNSSYDAHLYKLCDEAGIERFSCTRSVTPMRPVPSKAECSQRCCKNCWVMPASKLPWIGTFM